MAVLLANLKSYLSFLAFKFLFQMWNKGNACANVKWDGKWTVVILTFLVDRLAFHDRPLWVNSAGSKPQNRWSSAKNQASLRIYNLCLIPDFSEKQEKIIYIRRNWFTRKKPFIYSKWIPICSRSQKALRSIWNISLTLLAGNKDNEAVLYSIIIPEL